LLIVSTPFYSFLFKYPTEVDTVLKIVLVLSAAVLVLVLGITPWSMTNFEHEDEDEYNEEDSPRWLPEASDQQQATKGRTLELYLQ
jgi:hypothetical protein